MAPPRSPFRVPRSAAPLLLYTLIALGLLWPYRTSAVRASGDIETVLALVVEAHRALAPGEFPIRVAPDLQGRALYPEFQFYGNLPYTVAGALSAAAGGDPYLGWKLATLASLIIGGYLAYRLCLALTRNPGAALIGGAVFLCAPYMLTDLNARVAFTELFALNLLPAAFYFLLRCLRSRRWRYVVATAVTWALVALSHNITYLFGSLFAVLFVLAHLSPARARARLGRLAIVAVLHVPLVLWYFVPQWTTIHLLKINGILNPQSYADLTPWRVLLSPVLTNTPAGSETPNLGLQIGWPILAGVLIAIVSVFAPRRAARRTRWVLRFGALWVLALLIAWSPFDFWRHVPRTLWFVQFPYRLLMFVVLWGAVLTAFGLAALFRRRVPPGAVVAALACVGLSVAPFYPHPRVPLYENLVRDLRANPDLPRLSEFVPLAPALTIANADAGLPTGFKQMASRALMRVAPESVQYDADRASARVVVTRPTLLVLPVFDYPGLLEVRVDGRPQPYGDFDRRVAIEVPPGTHTVTIRFTGVRWANAVSLVGWGVIALILFAGVLRRVWSRRPFRISRTPRAGAGSIRISTVLVGFAAMAICVVIPRSPLLRDRFRSGPRVTASADHFTWDGLPEYAFDGLPETAWTAGTGEPTRLVVSFSRAATLHGIVLEPRRRLGNLFEGWHRVRLVVRDEGKVVLDRQFDFPRAEREPAQQLEFPPIRATEVELEFADPADVQTDARPIPREKLSPGYAEIRFLWDR